MKNRNLKHSDNWATPPEYYAELREEFDFDFDPCPYQHDLTKWDGLQVELGARNFINPPYSRKLKEAFVNKAILEANKGKLCVMLLPVSTSTKLFHEQILPNQTEIRFIKGRIKFCGINTKGEYVTDKAPMHDSMLVVFDGRLVKNLPLCGVSKRSEAEDLLIAYETYCIGQAEAELKEEINDFLDDHFSN